jgi:hypothetical protein
VLFLAHYHDFRIRSAFNVQVFGVDKMTTDGVPEVSKIVSTKFVSSIHQTVLALVPLMLRCPYARPTLPAQVQPHDCHIATTAVHPHGEPWDGCHYCLLQVIAAIIRENDLVLIQEVRDVSGQSPLELLEIINDGAPANAQFGLELSPR